MKVQFRKKSQITLPITIVQQLELKEGDNLEISIVDQTICLTPLNQVRNETEIKIELKQLNQQILNNSRVKKKKTLQKKLELYFECLGHFAIFHYGELVLLNNKKAEELIALLICERGCPISKGILATLLWPNSEKKRSIHGMSI